MWVRGVWCGVVVGKRFGVKGEWGRGLGGWRQLPCGVVDGYGVVVCLDVRMVSRPGRSTTRTHQTKRWKSSTPNLSRREPVHRQGTGHPTDGTNNSFGADARHALLSGVGCPGVRAPRPHGRTPYSTSHRRPDRHQDGVSVAGDRTPRQGRELGVMLVKQAASKTSDDAGDGTTTATVLAEAALPRRPPRVSQALTPTPSSAA